MVIMAMTGKVKRATKNISTFALVLVTVCGSYGSKALAQNIQNELNHEAQTVQQEMNRGMITPTQASQMDARVYQTEQQYQMDKATNGGHLNPMQAQQLRYQAGSVGQGIRGVANQNQWNNGALNNWSSGNFKHHHHPGPGGTVAPYGQGYGAQQNWNQGQGYGQQYQGYNGQQYPGQYPNQNFNQGGGMSQAGSLLRQFFH
jgi:hypothetical protein